MNARVFFSNKWNVWRVVYCGDVLGEWLRIELAQAYCDGYNAALVGGYND